MKLTTRIKQAIYPAYILMRSNRVVRKKVQALFYHYDKQANLGIRTAHQPHPLQLFSNMNEDGIILWIMATLGIRNGFFVDIGSNDCINSNCANLTLNLGWKGVFIDSDEKLLKIGERNYGLFNKKDVAFICNYVTPENINQMINNAAGNEGIDFMSIDIDGNDYSIFEAVTAKPKLVVVENKIEFGRHDIVVLGNLMQPDTGASPVAMTKLAGQKGYTLVAANRSGFNTFYLRNDLISDMLPAMPIASLLDDPSISKDFYPDNKMNSLLKNIQE